jgi:hypothetical protein
MFTVTKRLTSFVNYGPDFLMANMPWASKASFLWVKADDGNSRLTFKYGRGINSVGTATSRPIKTGDFVEIDMPSVISGNASTYVTIDNGTPPNTGGGNLTTAFGIPAGSNTSPVVFNDIDLNAYPLAYKVPVFRDNSTGLFTPGTLLFELDKSGNKLAYDAFNTAVALIPQSEIATPTHRMALYASVTSGVAATLELTLNA